MDNANKSDTVPFDPVAVLTTDAAVQAYVNDAVQLGDELGIADARRVAAQARIRISVRKRLIDQLRCNKDADEILDTDHFVTDLGMDSLDSVELVLETEDEFGIDISDEEIDSIQTVGDLINIVLTRASEENLRS